MEESGGLATDGGRYDPIHDSWKAINPEGAPPRGGSVVCTGAEMIVWGGETIGTVDPTLLNSGGRYDPISRTWTPTSRIDAPEARTDHTMVWTGSEVLVWGGRNEAGEVLGDGSRYDAETDTWSPISPLNAPESRRGHTAVWAATGPNEGRMIIWGGSRELGSGGEPGETAANGGGVYDPETDVWSPLATLNAPTPRVFHSATWTGSEMIVWGGLSVGADPQPLGDGSRYDPEADQWVALEQVDAPIARFSHSATWTGTALIVWGGMQGNLPDNALNTGGRYDPVSGDWESLTSSGAPYPRTRHTAVWAGHELIVWGGEAPGYITERFDDGGRYSPATKGWSPIEGSGVFTNGLGAPSRRQGHTAVWTGTQMLIWGGIGIEGFGEVFSRFNNSTWSYTPRKVMYLYQKQ